MTNLTIKSFVNNIAIVSYGEEYYDKEIVVPDEYVNDNILNENAFLLYASGFTPDKTFNETTYKTIFVGSNPKQRVIDILNQIGGFIINTNDNIWSDNIVYDWDQNEEMVRYVERHNMLYKMTRYLMHNKWVMNEVARLINLDFTMTMPRTEMLTPFPKIVYPKRTSDIDTFFESMNSVIVKPFYGLQDNGRVFDRKVYVNKQDFLNDIISHYDTIENFFTSQLQRDFVWNNTNKHNTPIMLQEHFDPITLTESSYRIIPNEFFNHQYIDPIEDEATKKAVDNFLNRSGTLKSDLLTVKCIKDQSGFVYIIDTSFAVNNYLDLDDAILIDIFKNAFVNLPST